MLEFLLLPLAVVIGVVISTALEGAGAAGVLPERLQRTYQRNHPTRIHRG